MLRIAKVDTNEPLLENDSSSEQAYILDDRIFVKHRDRMVKIFLQDILCAEADRNYCKIFTTDKEYLMTIPLKVFEDRLRSNEFLRIHRSYIVNLKRVDGLSAHGDYVHVGGKSLPVSRSSKQELHRRLQLF